MPTREKAGCDLVKNRERLSSTCFTAVVHRASPRFRFMLMSVKQARRWGGGGALTCLLNLPRMSKGYVHQCHCPSQNSPAPTPSHHPTAAAYSLSQLSVFMCPSCVVVVFLLWAGFYTVCQSPERHTLEGPVE